MVLLQNITLNLFFNKSPKYTYVFNKPDVTKYPKTGFTCIKLNKKLCVFWVLIKTMHLKHFEAETYLNNDFSKNRLYNTDLYTLG